MLLGGRNCTESTQCISLNCVKPDDGKEDSIGKCVGREEGKSCYQNSDCDKRLFCEKSSIYPYLSTCKKLRTTYELCENTDECQLNLYCWYGYKEDVQFIGENLKKCLPMYS
jgi:hypothetical protein